MPDLAENVEPHLIPKTKTWVVTYHDGDYDEVNAHAYSNIDGRAEFRNADGDLIGYVGKGQFRSVFLADALESLDDCDDDDAEEGLTDWEKELLATDKRARKAAEGIDTAVVTAVFTLTNGTTVTREFKLDSIDGPIVADLHADLDIEDVTKPGDVATVYAAGERRTVNIHIRGRGFAPGCGPAGPSPSREATATHNVSRYLPPGKPAIEVCDTCEQKWPCITEQVRRANAGEGTAEPSPAKEVSA